MRIELQEKDRVLESALEQVRAAAESAVESARLAEACKMRQRFPSTKGGMTDEIFNKLSEVIQTWRGACQQKDEDVRKLTRALEKAAEKAQRSALQVRSLEENLAEERANRKAASAAEGESAAELDRQLREAQDEVQDLQTEMRHQRDTFFEEKRRLQAELEAESRALREGRGELENLASELKRVQDKFEEERHKREAGEKYRESALKWRTEALVLKQRVEHKTKEIRELNHMLKAWDSMRSDKDDQISGLLEKCKKYEDDAKDKARSLDTLRRKLSSLATPRTGRTPPSAMPLSLGGSTVTLNSRLAGGGEGEEPPQTPRIGGTPLQGRLIFPGSDAKENSLEAALAGKPSAAPRDRELARRQPLQPRAA